MEINMQYNFNLLKDRVLDALEKTDLEYIRYELFKLKEPTITSGVGGSYVVSEFLAKVLNKKNKIISTNTEPRDLIYKTNEGYKNIISCSYSGNNYGVVLSFSNNLKKYLLSNNSFNNNLITYLKYDTSIEPEKSFISLGATMLPISIVLDYYLDGNFEKINENMQVYNYNFDAQNCVYEIFSGFDTNVTSTYLESTLMESGIGIPIVHDKYDYCHGRSTLSINHNNIAIYINRNTELDKLLLEELKKYYKEIVIIKSKFNDYILDDYQMLWQAMYLTKYIAEKQNKDLSKVLHSPITKKLYRYNGEL